MADSITAMGSSPIYFPLVPDWSNPPKIGYGISRDLIQFAGTASILKATATVVPLKFELSFITTNKDDEYDLLGFLHSIRGKNKRFWIEYPIKQFELKNDANSGATSLECYNNGFEKISKDNERIFFAMKSGDLIVRKVTDSNYDSSTEVLTLVIDSALDRDIGASDYFIFGRFLLVRSEDDTISQEIETNELSAWSMKLVELPNEYDEEEAS